MTTNKPEVFRVLGHRLHEDGPVEKRPYNWIKVVRLTDYEDLQAELKKAVAALTDGRFTRCDGPAGWRPPIGKPPAHITFGWSHIQEFWRLNPFVDWDQLEASIKAALAKVGTK